MSEEIKKPMINTGTELPLLVCPFCGGAGELKNNPRPMSMRLSKYEWKIECENRNNNKCPMNMRTHYQSTIEGATALWNRRESGR